MIPAVDLTILIYCIVIAAIGILANGFLLFITFSTKELRRKDYICFIINRTLIDFTFCVTLATVHPIAIYIGDLQSPLCTVVGFVELILAFSSIYTEPVLACNRFVSIF